MLIRGCVDSLVEFACACGYKANQRFINKLHKPPATLTEVAVWKVYVKRSIANVDGTVIKMDLYP